MANYTPQKTNNAKIREAITETKRNDKIRELHASGSYSLRALARIYHISYQRIAEIVKSAAPAKEVKGEALNG